MKVFPNIFWSLLCQLTGLNQIRWNTHLDSIFLLDEYIVEVDEYTEAEDAEPVYDGAHHG